MNSDFLPCCQMPRPSKTLLFAHCLYSFPLKPPFCPALSAAAWPSYHCVLFLSHSHCLVPQVIGYYLYFLIYRQRERERERERERDWVWPVCRGDRASVFSLSSCAGLWWVSVAVGLFSFTSHLKKRHLKRHEGNILTSANMVNMSHRPIWWGHFASK